MRPRRLRNLAVFTLIAVVVAVIAVVALRRPATRPAGLAVGAGGALYVSDDKAGFIYRISRR